MDACPLYLSSDKSSIIGKCSSPPFFPLAHSQATRPTDAHHMRTSKPQSRVVTVSLNEGSSPVRS